MIYWDPKPEIFRIPAINWPITWYGALFALGFALGFPLFVDLLNRYWGGGEKKKAVQVTDRLVLYMVLGTVLGARLGHFLFYEHPMNYLNRPAIFFKVWEGGLASHGAAIGIILSLLLFSYRIRPIQLSPLRLLDFISIPAALAGFFIRIGNFMNQEILGTPTNLPWAVTFGHPLDRSAPIPRHPVQLYEALFYLLVFLILLRLSYKPSILKKEGRLIGLFFILIFGGRFLLEFFKPEQSLILSSSLNMGQLLSIPLILVGLYLFKRN
jgi:prolipoprotein diacylglyceryl transferase